MMKTGTGTRKTLTLAAIAVAVIVVGAVVWWLASPLFVSRTVNEQFPAGGSVTSASATQTMASAAAVDKTMAEEMPDSMKTAVAFKTGNFGSNGDGFHLGSGQATVFKQPDGSYILRLENFKATNGPDLHVYLSPTNDPKNNGEVLVPGYVDLSVLKGNIGNQNYAIPANVDVTKLNSAIIWCKAFSVIFAVAPLNQPA